MNEAEKNLFLAGALIATYGKIAERLAQELTKAHPDGLDLAPLRDELITFVKGAVTNTDHVTEANLVSAQIQTIEGFFAPGAKHWTVED